MSKTLISLLLTCCIVAKSPALANYSELQASTSGLSGQTVTVLVHNPTAGAVSARVRVAVQLDNDTYLFLTSANFSLAGGATTSVTLTAPFVVTAIETDPEPIGSVE